MNDKPDSTENGASSAATAPRRNENSASASATNGSSSNGKSSKQQNAVECIDLDDDDDIVIEEVKKSDSQPPAAKRKRLNEAAASPVPDDPNTNSATSVAKDSLSAASTPHSTRSGTPATSAPSSTANNTTTTTGHHHATTRKEAPQLTSYSVLLDRLEAYVNTALEKREGVDRKILDVLLAAINIQVQKEPYSVRKLILEKQLVLPNTISFPPSQVVDVIIEHDADNQLSRVIAKLFADEKPKFTDAEKRERQNLKGIYVAPSMTKLFMDIGQDLVQESTYSDIVHARNLPEVPKNMDTYNQVAAQLKPVWESLRTKNERFHIPTQQCRVCGFKSDNSVVFSVHRQTPHFIGRKYQCAFCPEFDTNEHRINRHYIEVHQLKPLPREELPAKVQCPICEEDFAYKGHRDSHLKACKRDMHKIRTLQATQLPDHISLVNHWLWDKPPVEPSIVAQQQHQAKQQQQQLALQQQQQQRAAQTNRLAQQQLLSQQMRLKMISNNGGGGAAVVPNASNGRQSLANFTPQQQQQLLKLLNSSNVHQLPPELLRAALQLRQSQQLQQQQKGGLQKSGSPFTAGSVATNSALQKQSSSVPRARVQPNQPVRTSAGASLNGGSKTPSAGVGIPGSAAAGAIQCEICDTGMRGRNDYLEHLQSVHTQLRGKVPADMIQGAPLACSRCRDRFWTYEGLERHLVMGHGLVTSDLLQKAQRKEDSGRCKLCGKQYAFNMLQHLVSDHKVKLCSAEIMYSCDVCAFKCSSYQKLESHLSDEHPKNSVVSATR